MVKYNKDNVYSMNIAFASLIFLIQEYNQPNLKSCQEYQNHEN